MSQDASVPKTVRTMRLRYDGTCRMCGQALAAGTVAVYERATKTVRCQNCGDEAPAPAVPPEVVRPLSPPLADASPSQAAPPESLPDPGRAGAAARREHERRRDQREARIRAAHPRLGALMLAVSSEPQSTRAWATGAVGEEKLGARLNTLISPTVRVLHDRRIPRTQANIDHLVVCPGVSS